MTILNNDNNVDVDKDYSSNENIKRVSFGQLAGLLKTYKEYTLKIEKQLQHIQELHEADKSTVKEITVGNITVSLRFHEGIPVVPLDEAFAITVALQNLIRQNMENGSNNAETYKNNPKVVNTRPILPTLQSIQEIIANNPQRDTNYEV
jgi:hypothetical protein